MMTVHQLPRPGWKERLLVTATGGYKANLHNAAASLRFAPELAGRLAWNLMRLQAEAVAGLPWDEVAPRPWSNVDDLRLAEWLQAEGVNVSVELAQQAVELVAADRPHHPLRDWLAGLRWDGKPRVGKWLSYYLGAEHTVYSSAVGERWMISAVARVFRPGCKADHVLVLEGPQGKGKSTALRVLVGAAWFTDEISDLGSKDAAMQVRGVWLIELAELDHLSRQEVSRVKAFLTRNVDRFRPPYGRRLVDAPRECVFAGTVNDQQYLKDDTGNRRFWPVLVTSIDLASLGRDREQLWAEAVHLFRAERPWWLDTDELAAEAREQQEEREPEDPWVPRIRERIGDDARTTVEKVLGLVIEKKAAEWSRADEMRASRCLVRLGFVRKRKARAKDDPQAPRPWFYERSAP
jgi:putative DNA primase/helicase